MPAPEIGALLADIPEYNGLKDTAYAGGIEGVMQKGFAGYLNERDYQYLLQQGFKPDQFEGWKAEGGTIQMYRLKQPGEFRGK